MKRRLALACVLVVLVASFVVPATGTSLSGARYKVGAEIQFRVQDETLWWWGCCSCTPSQILGWRIASASGQVVFSVVHDAPVPAATWVGTWSQVDANAQAVPTGQYVLYVDTTAGTLSRCFSIYNPCACNGCWWTCGTCACQEVPSITTCVCKTSLVFVDTCTSGCFPLFWFGCGCSSCGGGCP